MSALDDFLDKILAAAADRPPPFAVATVATVGAGTPPPVTVTWNGQAVPARCPRDLVPTVGEVVLLARFGPQLFIIRAY